MTVRRLIAGSVACLLIHGVAQAQGGTIDPQCRGGTVTERITQDACQKAIDIFTFMVPQLGVGLTGGNAISGEHSVIGRSGHSSLGIRFNVVQARLPQIDDVTLAIGGAAASDYDVKDQPIPIPTIDAAVGLFRGMPIGGSYAFGVDALLNLSILPSMTVGDVEISVPDGPLKLGIGARISIVTESVLTPGISFTWLRRELPHVAVKGSPGGDEIDIDDFQVKTTAWRGVIGKNFGVLSISGGFGQDRYESSTIATVKVTRLGVTTTAGPIIAVQKLTRDNAFGALALNFGLLSIVVEGGRASGGDLKTYNTFGSDRADDKLTYGSLGLRFRF